VAAFEKMKWAITGGSGQLARSLVDLLDQENLPYRAWGHSELDITDISCISKIEEYSPDLLVNCAAWTNVEGAEETPQGANMVNKIGAENMALAANSLGIPLIHISTDYVFSGAGSQPWSLESKTEPRSAYGISKLLGEEVVKSQVDLRYYILRTGWLYGPHGKNFAKTILKKVLSTDDSINVVNDQAGQPTSTKSLVNQILKIANSNAPIGIYHATNSGEATWWDFARELVILLGEDVERIVSISSEDFPSKVSRPKYSVLDHSMWSNVGIEEMQDWRIALKDIFSEIRRVVEREILGV